MGKLLSEPTNFMSITLPLGLVKKKKDSTFSGGKSYATNHLCKHNCEKEPHFAQSRLSLYLSHFKLVSMLNGPPQFIAFFLCCLQGQIS